MDSLITKNETLVKHRITLPNGHDFESFPFSTTPICRVFTAENTWSTWLIAPKNWHCEELHRVFQFDYPSWMMYPISDVSFNYDDFTTDASTSINVKIDHFGWKGGMQFWQAFVPEVEQIAYSIFNGSQPVEYGWCKENEIAAKESYAVNQYRG